MIVVRDEVDVHMGALDVRFDGLGTFIVHNVERGWNPKGNWFSSCMVQKSPLGINPTGL